jgi:hypothetical protein
MGVEPRSILSPDESLRGRSRAVYDHYGLPHDMKCRVGVELIPSRMVSFIALFPGSPVDTRPREPVRSLVSRKLLLAIVRSFSVLDHAKA